MADKDKPQPDQPAAAQPTTPAAAAAAAAQPPPDPKAEAKKSAETAGDAGAGEVQERMDQIQEQGFLGNEADPTPNRNYAVEGAIAQAPTPETDDEARAKAQKQAGFRR